MNDADASFCVETMIIFSGLFDEYKVNKKSIYLKQIYFVKLGYKCLLINSLLMKLN